MVALSDLVSPEFRSLIGRAAVLVGTRFGGSLLTLVYTVLVARIATPEDFGLAMLGLSAALVASIPISLNIEGGSIRYLVAYRQSGASAKARGFLRFNLWVLLGLSGLLVLAAAAAWGAGLLGAATARDRVVLLVALAAPILAVTRVYGRHATALDAVLRGSVPRMLIRPSVFCLVLGVIWASDRTIAADTVMALFLVSAVLTALLQAWLLRGVFTFAPDGRADISDWRAWVGTGLMIAPLLLMRENLKNVIVVAAGLVLTTAEVGHLALALSVLGIGVHYYFSLMLLVPLAFLLLGGKRYRKQAILLFLLLTKPACM